MSLPQQSPAKARSGSQLMIDALLRNGATKVFGYPGGAIMPLYDALVDSGLEHILCRHEQGAAFAADAWGRVTRRAGVCMATSGPGATNLVTGIANAYLDSVPMVAITGQVPNPLQGTDAFQEVDIFGITLPIVKHSYIVRHVSEIGRIVDEAGLGAAEDDDLAVDVWGGHLDDDARLLHDLLQVDALGPNDKAVLALLDVGRELAAGAALLLVDGLELG
jgi:thiamine pyrophosphate-dependent acetolactate synthase large subunit-like protein